MANEVSVCVLLGNSDNKLTQREWSEFVDDVRGLVASYATETQFVGATDSISPYQTACIVFNMDETEVASFENYLERIRIRYRQDSIALVIAPVAFV